MTDLVYLGVAGAAAHFLLYRAVITRWLWSRYPGWLESFVSCSACTGFWIGVGMAFFWRSRETHALGLSADDPALLPACGLGAMVASPIFAWILVMALEQLSGDPGGEEAD